MMPIIARIVGKMVDPERSVVACVAFSPRIENTAGTVLRPKTGSVLCIRAKREDAVVTVQNNFGFHVHNPLVNETPATTQSERT